MSYSSKFLEYKGTKNVGNVNKQKQIKKEDN